MGKAIDMEPEYVGSGPTPIDMPPDIVNPVPREVDPLRQAIAVLHKLASPAERPDAVVGEDLMQPAVPGADMTMRQQQLEAGRPNVQDASLPVTGQSTVAPGTPQNRPDFAVGADRIGAEKGTPDTSGTAGFDPNANQYTPPKVPGSVGEANREVADQIAKVAATHEAHNQSLLAAQASHANAQADIYEEGATEAAVLGSAHERRIAHINAMADAETANHLTKLEALAKQEPNPARWWENQSGLGKALWALSLVFGAANAALTPGAKNAALDMVRQEIASDMARQEARTKREMAIEELRMGQGEKKAARNRSDAMDRYSRELTRWQALERAYIARAVAPNDMDAQAMKAEGMAFLEQQKLPIVMGFRQEKVAAAEAQANREFQVAQQNRAQQFQADQAMLQRNYDEWKTRFNDQRERDLAAVQIGLKTAGPPTDAKGRPLGQDGLPAVRTIPSGRAAGTTTGITVVGPDGQPAHGTGEMWFRKEDDKQAQASAAIGTGANRRYKALYTIRKALEDQNRAALMAAGVYDAELNAAITQLGTEGAKADDPGGRYTDKDFSRGVLGALGFDPNGNKLDRAKFAFDTEGVKKLLDKQMAEMPGKVNQAIAEYNDTGVNGEGTRAVWKPVDLEAPTVEERSQLEVEGKKATDYRPTSEADYDERLKKESENNGAARGQYLPDHDASLVTAMKSAAEGRAPQGVTAEAARILKQLDKREAAITEKPEKMDFTGNLAGSVFNRQTLSPDEMAELKRIRATRDIVSTVANDEIRKASEKMKKVEAWLHDTRFLTSKEVSKNQIIRRFNLKNSPREVEEIVERIRNSQGFEPSKTRPE